VLFVSQLETTGGDGDSRRAISNAVVATFKDYIGKGPTRARTYISDNMVVCLLEDTRTRAESSLIDAGEVDSVMATRKKFQDTMRHRLVADVERITRRKVVAFMSDSHLEPDFASETFVLDPFVLEELWGGTASSS
jgi:uncharacterized protein YbcI